MRHSSDIIKNIKRMRMANFTLGEIIAKTDLPKTTIYYHIRSIPKSKILENKISNISRATQKTQADKRRGKSIKNYTFLKPKKWSPEFVNLVSHFLFDGEISYSSCVYNNRSPVLISNVISLMKKCLGVDDFKIINKTDGVTRINFHNVEIAAFIKDKSLELIESIPRFPLESKRSFLKAFFDDEGSVYFIGAKRLVRGYQHSTGILNIVQSLLKEFGIYSYVNKKYFEVDIGKKTNLLNFQKHINFMPGLRVNGARSNSIWKKDLEKSKILEMAISSYQT